MINFASLFGSFNRGGSNAINDLLDKPDTPLEILLDAESFPNQYKSGNPKLQDYLTYDKYNELIQYIIKEGPADNQKKGYKYPMIAADVLSAQNNVALDYFLPFNGRVTLEVPFQVTEQVQIEVEDNDDQEYLKEQTISQQKPQKEGKTEEATKEEETSEQKKPQEQEKKPQQTEQKQQKREEQEKKETRPKKTKMIKKSIVVEKIRKDQKEPLIFTLLTYFDGPVNYTLAGYVCKVISMLFGKRPQQIFDCIFGRVQPLEGAGAKNYVQLISNHIQSKSVGQFLTKLLIFESADYIKDRKILYDYLVGLMSTITQSHVISNLAYTIQQTIQKTSTFVKSKQNIQNNQNIITGFMEIFYRTQKVHDIVNNTMRQEELVSGYNCLILHAYLHHTEIQTFNSFKLEAVLEDFIKKAGDRLRAIPERKTLGMGRVKLVEIFSFLIRKQRRIVEDDQKEESQPQQQEDNEVTGELLEELYIHEILANSVPDFFSILIRMVQTFENNNILHNEVFKIFEAVLRQPQENKSALQSLLLNEQNVLLNFLVEQSNKDKQLKSNEKHTRRKGYIGHVINLCRVIDSITENQTLNERIKKTVEFEDILNTIVAVDLVQTSKNLAGYQMRKNPHHQIMFQKEDIIAAYADFLTHCPKPQFQPEQKDSEEETSNDVSVETEAIDPRVNHEKERPIAMDTAQKQLIEEENDEEKFNEMAVNEEVDQTNPKYWISHLNYDVDSLMNDLA